MNELKTLKEIDLREEILKTHDCKACEGFSNCTEDVEKNIVNKIKQEAIKWIKSKNTGGFSFIIRFDGKVTQYNKTKEKLNSIDYTNLGAMIEFINFFNITEEDLK